MEIRRENYEGFTSQALVAALNAELLDRYDGFDGSGGEHAAADFAAPDGAFVVGWEDGEPVACGGVIRYDETTAEIRRMYVAPSARGRGLSRAPARRARGRGAGARLRARPPGDGRPAAGGDQALCLLRLRADPPLRPVRRRPAQRLLRKAPVILGFRRGLHGLPGRRAGLRAARRRRPAHGRADHRRAFAHRGRTSGATRPGRRGSGTATWVRRRSSSSSTAR